ncbi:MAG: hypothetical protein Q8M03_08685 [Legionella sp.]|nr:hypothetical protein [Legionella sp.]
MIEGEVYAGGLALNFFDSADLEALEEGNSSEKPVKIGRNVLRLLMMGWQENWKELLTPKLLNAVFVKRDHQLTKGMREAFQQGFSHLYSQLHGREFLEKEQNQAELFISNCLTYLPFADITPYESFAIPQWVSNEWQLVNYRVVPIELTPTSGFKKLFIHDTDRVFAYGLEPISNRHASPHLIFMGTTYPAGQGFSLQVNTDLESFETVGKKLYRSGHKNISNWLDKQASKVHVCGSSLGGSLALLLAADQGDKLSRVDALNPAGLYHPWYKSKFDHWDELLAKPEVFIQKQKGRLNAKGDPVSRFGIWKPEWHILSVTAPLEKSGPNSMADHALNYAGFAETEFIGVDTKKDNEERKLRNFWAYTLGRSALYYLTQIPYRYVIHPIAHYIFNNKLQVAIAAALFVFLCFFPAFAAGFVFPFVGAVALVAINAAISAVIGAYLLSNFFFFIKDKFTYKKESDLSKFADWFMEQSILVKSVFITGFSLAAAAMLAVLFLPAFIPLVASTTLFFIASIPILMKTVYNLVSMVKILTGLNEITPPECHEPYLERNSEMDIYNKDVTLEATFTYGEVADYYFVKRHLLKNKDFLPPKNAKSKVNFGELSKYEVINIGMKSPPKKDVVEENDLADKAPVKQDALPNIDHSLTVRATRAKIADMEQTVRLINRFGIYGEINHKLIQEFRDVERVYSYGKK